jgi:hypothetical protein
VTSQQQHQQQKQQQHHWTFLVHLVQPTYYKEGSTINYIVHLIKALTTPVQTTLFNLI